MTSLAYALRLGAGLLALAIIPADPASAAVGVGSDPDRILAHLRAFQDIAATHGGHRAAGTPGYDRSADYVADQLRAAGYEVSFEEFTFPFSQERSPPVLAVSGAASHPREALRTLQHSASADVTAPLQAVDLGLDEDSLPPSTSACEREDFAGFVKGRIALVRRGTCPFQVKVEHAVAAGAVGVVIMNEGRDGQTGTFGGRLAGPAPVPVLGTTTEVGRALARAAEAPEGAALRLAVDIESGTRTTRNVIAAPPGLAPGEIVAVGAHLDSVPEGPGINDNASGSAAVLEAALRLAGEVRPIRFAFWGAEERGLLGSRHHVSGLDEAARRRSALYVNLDMVGSPHPVRILRSRIETAPGLATDIRQGLATFFRERGLPAEEHMSGNDRRGGGSDDASFAREGIPTVMLYTGAGEAKSEAQAEQFGGAAGQPFDPCYHKTCDTLDNIDPAVLRQMADALVHALRRVPVGGVPAGPAAPTGGSP
jgi:Zn-dependent M28 family amino/carboxypeptidase